MVYALDKCYDNQFLPSELAWFSGLKLSGGWQTLAEHHFGRRSLYSDGSLAMMQYPHKQKCFH